MKRIITITLCCLMFLPFQVLTASARGRLESLTVESTGLPNEAVYMDLLIFMDENDEAYTTFNEENLKQYSFDATTIAEYNSEGFVSMSCHYKDNFTKMEIIPDVREDYLNSFALEKRSDGSLGTDYDLVKSLFRESRQFRIVLLDKNGSIIQISESFVGEGKDGRLMSYIDYDAENNKLSLEYDNEGPQLLRAAYILFVLLWKYILAGTVIVVVIAAIAVTAFLIHRRQRKKAE